MKRCHCHLPFSLTLLRSQHIAGECVWVTIPVDVNAHKPIAAALRSTSQSGALEEEKYICGADCCHDWSLECMFAGLLVVPGVFVCCSRTTRTCVFSVFKMRNISVPQNSFLVISYIAAMFKIPMGTYYLWLLTRGKASVCCCPHI